MLKWLDPGVRGQVMQDLDLDLDLDLDESGQAEVAGLGDVAGVADDFSDWYPADAEMSQMPQCIQFRHESFVGYDSEEEDEAEDLDKRHLAPLMADEAERPFQETSPWNTLSMLLGSGVTSGVTSNALPTPPSSASPASPPPSPPSPSSPSPSRAAASAGSPTLSPPSPSWAAPTSGLPSPSSPSLSWATATSDSPSPRPASPPSARPPSTRPPSALPPSVLPPSALPRRPWPPLTPPLTPPMLTPPSLSGVELALVGEPMASSTAHLEPPAMRLPTFPRVARVGVHPAQPVVVYVVPMGPGSSRPDTPDSMASVSISGQGGVASTVGSPSSADSQSLGDRGQPAARRTRPRQARKHQQQPRYADSDVDVEDPDDPDIPDRPRRPQTYQRKVVKLSRTGWCDLCGKMLKRLDKHMMVHEDIKPHECPQCHLCFRQSEHLRRHRAAKHGKRPEFPCPECGKILRRKDKLVEHMLRHSVQEN